MTNEYLAGAMLWLGTYAFHSTLLLGGVWLIERFWRNASPALLATMWRTALVASLATATLQVGGVISPISGRLPVELEEVRTVYSGEASQAQTGGAYDVEQGVGVGGSPDEAGQLAVAGSDEFVGNAPTAAAPAKPARFGLQGSVNWQLAVLGAWVFGIMVLATRHGRSLIRMHRQLANRKPVSEGELFARVEMLSRRAGLDRAARVSVSDTIDSPFTLIGGEICIPDWTQSRLPQDQLDAMLAHEIAHVRNGDNAWLAIVIVLEAVFFFQPLNRVARSRIDHHAELCADDWAATQADDGRPLAHCLSHFAGMVRTRKTPEFAAAMARPKSPLVQRVERLVSGSHTNGAYSMRATILITISALGLTAVMPGLIAQAKDAPAPDRSVSIRDSDDGVSISVNMSNDDADLRVKGQGDFQLASDGVSIAGISDDGFLDVRYSRDGLDRRVRIAGAGAELTKQYWRNGQSRVWDQEADQFLREMMPMLFRETGLMARQRVEWLLANEGHGGVVAEIGLIKSDSIQRAYATIYAEAATIPDTAMRTLLGTIKREMSSDSSLRATLVAIHDTQKPAGAQLAALIEAAETIQSDSESRALLQTIDAASLNPEDVTTAYLAVAGDIASDSEMRVALLHLLGSEALNDDHVQQTLELARISISSSSELRRVLEETAGRVRDSDQLAIAYLNAADAIDSSSERARALSALTETSSLNASGWASLLSSAAGIGSDSEKARLLIKVAERMPRQGGVVAAYRSALDTISSDSEYRRAERALQ